GRATSASIRAAWTSPMAASTSASVRAPRPRSLSKTPLRRDCRLSNKSNYSKQLRQLFQRASPQGAQRAAWGRSPAPGGGPERPLVFPESGRVLGPKSRQSQIRMRIFQEPSEGTSGELHGKRRVGPLG